MSRRSQKRAAAEAKNLLAAQNAAARNRRIGGWFGVGLAALLAVLTKGLLLWLLLVAVGFIVYEYIAGDKFLGLQVTQALRPRYRFFGISILLLAGVPTILVMQHKIKEDDRRLERMERKQQEEAQLRQLDSQRSAARDEEILREVRAIRGIEAPKLLPIDTNSAVTYTYGNLSASLTLLSTDNGQWVYRINSIDSPNIHERGTTLSVTLRPGLEVGIVNADDKSLRASVLVSTTGQQVPWMGIGPRIERGSGVASYVIQGKLGG